MVRKEDVRRLLLHGGWEDVPDSILHEVLDYLKGFQAKTPEEQKRVIGLKRILDEKRDLLLHLAK